MAEPFTHILSCGCVLNGTDHSAAITYCLMHKAAPEMLAALETIANVAIRRNLGRGNWARPIARKALAAAKGQPQEAK